MHRDLKKAYKLYSEFREVDAPQRGREIEFDMPKVLMSMGTVLAIEYETTIGGKAMLMRHEFSAGSKPVLCAGPHKNQLFIIEGRYHVTERGIVDLDARGREIEDN